MSDSHSRISLAHTARIIGLAALIIGSTVAVAAALICASDIFLILFLGILFAVFLVRTSELLANQLPLGYGWSLGIFVTALVAICTASVALFGVQVNEQMQRAEKQLEESGQRLTQVAKQYPFVKSTISSTPFLRELLPDQQDAENPSQNNAAASGEGSDERDAESEDSAKSRRTSAADSGEQQAVATVATKAAQVVTRIFKTTFGLAINSLLIFFVGLFLAIAPHSYRDGLVILLPQGRRARAREVLNDLGDTLWRWLLGRFGSMLITGIGAAILLGSLGVPMGIALGVVTGLLTFIPNIGSAIALFLAMLFALPQGGGTVLAVLVGYMMLQLVESYVVTPLIQQQQVSLPPALLIATQAVMGVLFGFLGAAVASPMLAAGKKGVEEVYVKDILGDDASEPNGSKNDSA